MPDPSSEERAPLEPLSPRAPGIFAIAAALLVLLLAVAPRYGVFRDELYYVACGQHLAFGYVDHPPFVALVAKLAITLFGRSVFGLRVFPALAGVATVLVAAELARTLRGGSFAQVLAALAVAVAPGFLAIDHFLSMNCFEPLSWTAVALFATRALVLFEHDRRAALRAWISLGVVCGLGLLDKHSMTFFAGALAVGVVATAHRRAFATRGPWIAVAIAAVLILPNLAWEVTHHWPTLEFMHNAQTKKMVRLGPGKFLVEQLMQVGPIAAPIWLGGLGWLLAAKRARAYRFLGVAYLVLLAFFLVAGAKPYYLAPVYPILFAPGGVAIEEKLARPILRACLAGAFAILSILGVFIALPILSPEAYIKYASALGVKPASGEKNATSALPQYLADQFGWESMAKKLAAVYRALPADEQRVTAIYGDNYGEASTTAFFAPDLPPACSGHNAFFMWGPPEGRGDVLIAVGVSREDLESGYDEVVEVDRTSDPYAMPFENDRPIFLCRHPKRPLAEMWPSTKHYI